MAIRKWFVASCATALALLASVPSHAFGLRTHLWIGERILQDVRNAQDGCKIRIPSVRNTDAAPALVPLNPQVCRSLRDHPEAFLSGVLGPDVFPDMLTGQVTTHPGVHGDWSTADWLIHVYRDAAPGPELAFAAGYLVHAASDVFAHTYVNAYAGDIFDLLDGDRRVEARHFLLEKYIDLRLPPFAYAPERIKPPIGFVLDKLVHDRHAGRLAGKSKAHHIRFMQAAWAKVDAALDEIEGARAELASVGLRVKEDASREAAERSRLQLNLQRARQAESSAALRLQVAEANVQKAAQAMSRSLGIGQGSGAAGLQQAESLRSSRQQELQLAQSNVQGLRDAIRASELRLGTIRTASLRLPAVLRRSKLVAAFYTNWRASMVKAGEQYLETSHRVAMGTMQGRNLHASEYQSWLRCFGRAYIAVPVQATEAYCEAREWLEETEKELKELVAEELPPPYGHVYAVYLATLEQIQKDLRQLRKDAAYGFVQLVAPERDGTERFIALLANRMEASQEALNAEFRSAGADRPLLVYPRVSDVVDRDMHVQGEVLDAERFAPLYNAVVLSKLALMDVAGIRELAGHMGGDASQVGDAPRGGRHSILYDMVRSIDGNHQWQPYGLPYPMSHGKALPSKRASMQYGYGPLPSEADISASADHLDPKPPLRRGTPIFIHAGLREQVFQGIFKGPVHEHLFSEPQPGAEPYPFRECAKHPFAVGFDAEGRAVGADERCSADLGASPVNH